MAQFRLQSDYQPCGDQPQAIKELVEGIDRGDRHQVLLGVTGSGKTFTMANVVNQLQRPTLVLAHNKTLAAQLYGEFKELFPDKIFLYISHNLMEVAKFCREILVFSLPSKKKGSFLINGQNYLKGYGLNKDNLDKTMLEIMNAF